MIDHSMQALCRAHSQSTNLGKNDVVVLICTNNQGGSQRYACISILSPALIATLIDDGFAYFVTNATDYDRMIDHLKHDLEGERLLDVEVYAYRRGERCNRFMHIDGHSTEG